METTIKKVSKYQKTQQSFNFGGYMPRVYDVRSPCQWLDNCHSGKCPALTKINGNFYCARPNQIHT